MATLEADWIGGLRVSPDGRTILYGRGSSTSDLTMIERFAPEAGAGIEGEVARPQAPRQLGSRT